MAKMIKLKELLIKEQEEQKCPSATQNLVVNTANRDRAIQADFIKYGPLNVEEPGDYWKVIKEMEYI